MPAVRKFATILLPVLLLSFVASCSDFWEPRSVVTNLPGHEPVLVINGFITPDSVFEISVAKSRPFLAPYQTPWVTNASVAIYEADNLVAELFHFRDGSYRAVSETPEIGRTYELRVSASGFKPVQAEAFVPVPIAIDSLAVTDAIDMTRLTLYFQDPPNRDDFYQLLVFFRETYAPGDTILSLWSFVSSDAVLRKPDDFENESYFYDDAFFDDALFEGEFYDLDISFYKSSYAAQSSVVLLTTSESYYNFRQSLAQQDDTEGNPFAEPVPVYSNIVDGLGVFAAYSSQTRPVFSIQNK